MSKKKHRTDHTTRLLRWICEYGGLWYLICTPGDDHVDLDMLRHLVEKLHEADLDELIFVLLMVHRDHPALRQIPEYLPLRELSVRWQDDREQIGADLVGLLT